jgi:anti-sigma-K factor RskA
MAYSEDHSALAAEYVVGILDAEERAQVETMMAVDKDFAALVRAWQFRLSALNQMVGLVEPRAEVWDRIKAEIAKAGVARSGIATADVVTSGRADSENATSEVKSETPSDPSPDIAAAAISETSSDTAPASEAPIAAPETSPPELPAPVTTAASQTEAPPFLPAIRDAVIASDNAAVLQLGARVRQWRTVANAMTALAAVLLAALGIQIYRPELLPAVLRPRLHTQIEAKAPPAQFVALLQNDGASPAFILTVDAGSRTFTVRRVGAGPEPGKNYELWLVSDRLQQPRSLGVIGSSDFTTRPALSSYDADMVSQATYAVTLEPEGGSPSGVPTGQILFSGKLIETVPQPTSPPG